MSTKQGTNQKEIDIILDRMLARTDKMLVHIDSIKKITDKYGKSNDTTPSR